MNVESKRGLALTVNMFLLAEITRYLTNPFVLTCQPGEAPQLPPLITTGMLAHGQTGKPLPPLAMLTLDQIYRLYLMTSIWIEGKSRK